MRCHMTKEEAGEKSVLAVYESLKLHPRSTSGKSAGVISSNLHLRLSSLLGSGCRKHRSEMGGACQVNCRNVKRAHTQEDMSALPSSCH